jgi:hypothetical protein
MAEKDCRIKSYFIIFQLLRFKCFKLIMNIKSFKPKIEETEDSNLQEAILKFEDLLTQLRKKELETDLVSNINSEIEYLNTISDSAKVFKRQIKKKQIAIIKLVEEQAKLVVKNHYRNLWLATGMAVFGIPLGVVFGLGFGNMAFLGIGLPIGLVIGIAVGTHLDNKAKEEGRQLDFEMD